MFEGKFNSNPAKLLWSRRGQGQLILSSLLSLLLFLYQYQTYKYMNIVAYLNHNHHRHVNRNRRTSQLTTTTSLNCIALQAIWWSWLDRVKFGHQWSLCALTCACSLCNKLFARRYALPTMDTLHLHAKCPSQATTTICMLQLATYLLHPSKSYVQSNEWRKVAILLWTKHKMDCWCSNEWCCLIGSCLLKLTRNLLLNSYTTSHQLACFEPIQIRLPERALELLRVPPLDD